MCLNPPICLSMIDSVLMFIFAFFTVDPHDELDELTNLLDFDSFEAEESNKKCSTLSAEPHPPISGANKLNITKSIQENSIFERENKNIEEKSEVHGGDTDSSDDEDNRYSADHQNYTDSGRSIKTFLKKQTSSDTYFDSKSSSWKSKKVSSPASQQPGKSQSQAVVPVKTPLDIYSDPFFGIRIM